MPMGDDWVYRQTSVWPLPIISASTYPYWRIGGADATPSPIGGLTVDDQIAALQAEVARLRRLVEPQEQEPAR